MDYNKYNIEEWNIVSQNRIEQIRVEYNRKEKRKTKKIEWNQCNRKDIYIQLNRTEYN